MWNITVCEKNIPGQTVCMDYTFFVRSNDWSLKPWERIISTHQTKDDAEANLPKAEADYAENNRKLYWNLRGIAV